MKKYPCFAIVMFALSIFALLSVSVSAQTLSLNDGSIIQSKTNRIGVNIGAIDYWDSGQILKNLIGATNPGFEPLQNRQIWALTAAGTATTFTIPDQYDGIPPNYWAGGTFTVVESQSGGAELGCTGTIASNTGPNYPLVGQSTYTAPSITVSTSCNSAFSVGDTVVLTKSTFPTPESWWESGGRGGMMGSVSGGGQLLTDTTDLCATCGTQSLNMNAAAGGSSANASFYFDSCNTDDMFVMMNGTYQLSFWAKAASGTPVLSASASRLSAGGFNCGTYTPKLSSSWAQYTFNCTASESQGATTPGNSQVAFNVTGGSVYLDNVSFEKTNTDSSNTTVLRDEVIDTLKKYYGPSVGSNPGTFRYWVNQNAESMSNWTQPKYAQAPTGGGTGYFVGPGGSGVVSLSLEDYLVICQLLNAEPYLEVPVTFSTSEAANLIEFLASPSSTTYGARRATLGQDDPWTSVFSTIHLSFCNECWNGGSFPAQSLAYRSSVPNSEYYYDYSLRTRDIFAAMRADAYYSAPSFDLVMNAQTATSYSMDTAIQRARPDSIEIEGYTYSYVNSFDTDTALWQPAMVEPYEKVTNPSDIYNFYQSVHDYQSQKTCGASGTAACNVNIYEWGQGTIGGSIDQTHMDYINAGAGEGVVMALQPLLNLQYFGIRPQSFFSLTEFRNGAGNGLVNKLWGNVVDMGGATNNVRPEFLGVQLVNQSIIGSMYACPIANNPTFNFAGSPNGITPMPALNNVPYLYAFCFENGTKRSLVLINTDLSSSHTISFAGTNPPAGTVTQRQYAPAALNDMNESHSGTVTNLAPATVAIETSTLSSPGSITLPPHSATALDYDSTGLTTAAMPTFSPAAGTYSTSQSVTISDATAGATIYYTTNGTTPTTSSSIFSGPITVSATETIEAIAVETGYSNSVVATATYTIGSAALPAPTFSPAGGTYSTSQSVTISDATAGTTIYYTTNGTTPTTSSSVYSGPITVSATETIEAIAVETGYSNSAVATATYTIGSAALPTPTFSPAAGTYSASQSVTISDATAGTTIYYTTNGATPTTSSTKYTGAITVSATETIEAIAVETGYSNSAVATAAYTIGSGLPAPAFSPVPGTFTSPQSVTISDTTTGAAIYYTTDGTTPTASSTRYIGAIWQSSTQTLKAIAVETGYANSPVTTAAYTIAPVLPAPTFSPQGGGASWALFTTPPSVTISDSHSGVTFYYTTNGATPTTSSTLYTGPITVSATETIEAIAVQTGYANSPVSSMLYTIAPLLPAPTFSLAGGNYTSSQTVTISDVTAGTTIYYTTNGSTPTTSSTMYTGAITVSATETIKAIAAETGYCNSPAAAASYTISAALPSPAFSPAAGTYTTSQTVAIGDSQSGTTIYYTTNGTIPTTSSSKYSGAITVSATQTINAIATETGYTNSTVATAAYTINPVLPTPTFSLTPGSYTTSQSVTISDATAGTTIYYTTNGSTPTTSSSVYSGAITVNATETLEAIAVKSGYTNSAVGTAAYSISLVLPAPTFSLAAGNYTTSQSVTISDATAGTTIYYTTNGTTPTTSSTKYTGAITVSVTETLEAIAVESGYSNSPAVVAAYTISPAVSAPIFSPAPGTFTSPQSVSISDGTSGAAIYYTTDGSTPTASSTRYMGAIWQSSTQTLKAIAVETGYANSPVTTASYAIAPVLPAPTFSPQGGGPSWALFTTPPAVTLSDTQAGVTFYYTTNGTTPTTSSTLYTGPITVNATETIEAIAVKTGYTNSPASSMLYSIAPLLPAPAFSLAGGNYTSSQTVTISDATAGTTIYYTTNGTTPTTSSTKYAGAITVKATETLEAIAVESGYCNSAAATATYTISGSANTSTVSGFTISSSTPSATATPGGSVAIALTVTPLSPATTFPTAVNLLASGLPVGATYSLSPASVAEGAGPTAVTLTVKLPQTVSNSRPPQGVGGTPGSRMTPFALALLLMPFAGKLRNAGKRLGRMRPTLLMLAAAMVVIAGLGGCGATNDVVGPTHQVQTYTMTVIGTTGTLSESTTVTLTVKS